MSRYLSHVSRGRSVLFLWLALWMSLTAVLSVPVRGQDAGQNTQTPAQTDPKTNTDTNTNADTNTGNTQQTPPKEEESRRDRIARKRRMIDELANREREKLAQESAEREKAKMEKKLGEEKEKQEGGEEKPAPPKPGTSVAGAARTSAPSSVLLLKPLNQSVEIGKRFATSVVFRADTAQPIDQLEIQISYPPLEVRPRQVFDFPLHAYLKDASATSTTIADGILRYTARLNKPMPTLGETELLHVAWEALAPSDSVDLVLGYSNRAEGRGSSIWYRGFDLLKSQWLVGQACINATVVCKPPAEAVRGLRIMGDRRHASLSGPEKSRDESRPGMSLDLLRPAKAPRPGDEFVVDVMLHNPGNLALNEVRLAIGYDPRAVEVLDWDFLNWIKRGVNVFDAHAHTRFPFNIHNRNEVDNYRGRITYQMGTTFLRPMPSGSLVRIRCRALTPGAAQSFTLFPEGQTATWNTDVRGSGESVLMRSTRASGTAFAMGEADTPRDNAQ